MLENQRVKRDFPTAAGSSQGASLAEEARTIASAVRRIGRGRGASPESMLIQKHDAADRLLALASRLEVAR